MQSEERSQKINAVWSNADQIRLTAFDRQDDMNNNGATGSLSWVFQRIQ
jgi:hypothetical protein